MTITSEISLRNFEFWSGGKERADMLTCEELDSLEPYIEELFPDGITDTGINDLFWFDFDTIAEYLGYKNEEHFTACREHGGCKDRDEVYDKLEEEFDDYNTDSFDEWIDDEWDYSMHGDEISSKFKEWYAENYVVDADKWINYAANMFSCPIDDVKRYIDRNDITGMSISYLNDHFDEWLDEKRDDDEE